MLPKKILRKYQYLQYLTRVNNYGINLHRVQHQYLESNNRSVGIQLTVQKVQMGLGSTI